MGAILEFKDDQYEDLLEYINKLLSYGKKIKESVEECERYNIDIIFTLVQGEIESHFGTKGLGAKINNVFNVGVFDNKTK